MSVEILGSPPNKNIYAKYAKGTQTGNFTTIIVNNLNFTPKKIAIYVTYVYSGITYKRIFYYDVTTGLSKFIEANAAEQNVIFTINSTGYQVNISGGITNVNVWWFCHG